MDTMSNESRIGMEIRSDDPQAFRCEEWGEVIAHDKDRLTGEETWLVAWPEDRDPLVNRGTLLHNPRPTTAVWTCEDHTASYEFRAKQGATT